MLHQFQEPVCSRSQPEVFVRVEKASHEVGASLRQALRRCRDYRALQLLLGLLTTLRKLLDRTVHFLRGPLERPAVQAWMQRLDLALREISAVRALGARSRAKRKRPGTHALPANISCRRIPMAHQSDAGLRPTPRIISGATYSSVPQSVKLLLDPACRAASGEGTGKRANVPRRSRETIPQEAGVREEVL